MWCLDKLMYLSLVAHQVVDLKLMGKSFVERMCLAFLVDFRSVELRTQVLGRDWIFRVFRKPYSVDTM